MSGPVVVLSVPGLRGQDLAHMPTLEQIARSGSTARIAHSFPCVTWPSQCNLLTGALPSSHGVVANGFYWRDKREVEMWTAWNDVIELPQLWDLIKAARSERTTAVWFPMLAKGCGADIVCMPAPIHKPDGSEDLWCYTKPQEFYGELLGELGHFPLKHFWGPLAGIQSSRWIVESAILAARKFKPDFWFIYLPHLDYAAQKFGPDSSEAVVSLGQLDTVIAELTGGFSSVYGPAADLVVASEYVISPVSHFTCPNRLLRDANLLSVSELDDGTEQIDFVESHAWALVDHQFAHVFVADGNPMVIEQVVNLFCGAEGIQMAVAGDDRQPLGMDHPRSGDVILVSQPNSWMAYYWWYDDLLAPAYARTVDIHRKPGYDPLELFLDPVTRSIPLDASLIKGSHGAPAVSPQQQGALVCSRAGLFDQPTIADTRIGKLVLELSTGQ